MCIRDSPYSSQTTAHILDVMKEGAIHNENTYTVNAFKTIVDFGSNYDTAIGFMWQPAIDILVRKWKETNSAVSYTHLLFVLLLMKCLIMPNLLLVKILLMIVQKLMIKLINIFIVKMVKLL